jgi:hypothetical protein
MNAPKTSASKKRLRWEQLPAGTKADIERLAGGRVVAAANCTGGFSPGLASRLELASGRNVFVKATDAAEWPDQAPHYRAEAFVSAALPACVPAPRLLGWHDDGRWVIGWADLAMDPDRLTRLPLVDQWAADHLSPRQA